MMSMRSLPTIPVRHSTVRDLAFCARMDRHVPRAWLRRKIAARELWIAAPLGRPAGYLRMEYLWGQIPYIGLIVVAEGARVKGLGRAMLERVCREERRKGRRWLFSSSQSNDPEPQAWHRRMGFEECGVILGVNDDGVGELFFRKRL
jgi:predicted GNAT superfamily acetyltransferase